MNRIFIFSNVAYPREKAVRTDPGDILVFLNKATSAEYYRDAPAARKMLFRRRGIDSFGRDLDFCENYNIEKGGLPASFIRGLEKSYDWDYDSGDSRWRGMTTGYIVAMYMRQFFEGWEVVLVNFGYEVRHSTTRRKDHNWKFEAAQLAAFKRIFTAETQGSAPNKKVLYITGGHLGDSVYASAVVENILATGRFAVNVAQTYPGVWDHCGGLDRTITRQNADFVIRNEYLGQWRNGCPSLIEGVLRVAEQKTGTDILRKFMKPVIYAPLPEGRLFVESYYVIATGFLSSCPLKNWGARNWKDLIDLFPGKKFVQAGSRKANAVPVPGAVDYLDRTDFVSLCRLIRDAECVIAPPNGLIHIAGALDVPFVALAGGREPSGLIGYPSGRVLSVCGALPCCRRGGCRKTQFGIDSGCGRPEYPVGETARVAQCMVSITPQMVADAVRAVEKSRKFCDSPGKIDPPRDIN